MIAITKLLQGRRQLWNNFMTKTSNSQVHAEWRIVYIVFCINDSILDKSINVYINIHIYIYTKLSNVMSLSEAIPFYFNVAQYIYVIN